MPGQFTQRPLFFAAETPRRQKKNTKGLPPSFVIPLGEPINSNYATQWGLQQKRNLVTVLLNVPAREHLPLPCAGQVLQQVEEDESEPDHLQEVGHHGEGGQVLEVLDGAQQQHGQQDYAHVRVVV